jgi:predicted kinase
MAHLHLVVGPPGAGKSTFALQLSRDHGAVRLTLDEWMSTLFSQDRPATGIVEWYIDHMERCIEQIWRLARNIIDVGTDVVLEIGLIQQRNRQRFYERVDAAGYDLTIYVLEASCELRRERVQERNCEKGVTFSMEVPPLIFELISARWEPPDEFECNGRDVRFIYTDQ